MSLRVCTPRVIDRDLSVHCALREHAGNHPWGIEALSLAAPQRAALVTGKAWKPGRTLRVGFDASVPVQRRSELKSAAADWMKVANIIFVFVDSGPCEVRVSADPRGGSWSYVGTDILGVPDSEPTMNLGWPEDLGRSRHELGHTLGLIHEHQNPDAKIPWDRDACYAFYGGAPNYWSHAEVDAQVLDVDTEPLTNGGWDRSSIMEYPIDGRLVTDPSFAVGFNLDLSDLDRAFIGRMYPFDGTPVEPVTSPPDPPPPVPTTTTSSLTGALMSLLAYLKLLYGFVSHEINFEAVAKHVAEAEAQATNVGLQAAFAAILANSSDCFPDVFTRPFLVALTKRFAALLATPSPAGHAALFPAASLIPAAFA